MPYDSGFSRRSVTERDMQPVAIISVDPTSRTAIGVTRTRHTLHINTAYATGDSIVTPSAGEQWYVERFDMEWRLYSRIPFNDATLNIKPEAGQVSVGSATGPLELNGTEVRANNIFRLNNAYYRDNGVTLERSDDKLNWSTVSSSGIASIAGVLTPLTAGDDPLTALRNWAAMVQAVVDNFGEFWTEVCQNIFVGGLKQLGVGDTDLGRIMDGFQNFIDYLFGVVFCDFDGHVTPQTMLVQLRDLLAPVINNPFVQGLQEIANILGISHGNLLNDAVEGVSGFLKLVFDIITCNWSEIPLPELGSILGLAGDGPFSPASIVAAVFGLFDFLGNPSTPVGQFIAGLQSFLGMVGETTGNLLKDAVSGAVKFFQTLFGILTCDPAALATAVGLNVTGTGISPDNVLNIIGEIVKALVDNPFVQGLKDFAQAMGVQFTNLFDGAILGATEMIKTLVNLLTCGLSSGQAASLATVVAGFSAGTFNPAWVFKTLGDLVSLFANNPVVKMLTDGAASLFGVSGNLITKLLGGLTGSVNWVLKVLKTLFPFVPWATLLPFVDWTAVDATSVASIGSITGLANPLNTVFKPLENIITGGTQTLTQFFAGFGATGTLLQQIVSAIVPPEFTGLLTDPLGALKNFIGPLTAGGGTLIDQIAQKVTNITGNAEATTLLIISAITNIPSTVLDALADPLAKLREFFAGINADDGSFINQLAKALTGGTGAIGLPDVGTFFTNLRNMLGPGASGLLSGSFNPAAALNALASALAQTGLLPSLDGLGKLNPAMIPQLGVDVLTNIETYVRTRFIQPLIGTIVTNTKINIPGLGIDFSNLSPEDFNLTTLGTWANNLVTNLTKIPASNIFGSIAGGLLGVVPVGHIAETAPNLLSLGAFSAPSTIEAVDGWSWDAYANRSGLGGAARVDITSAKDRELFSRQSVPVIPGDNMTVKAYVLTSGLAHSGGGPVSVRLRFYSGQSLISTVTPITTGANTSWPSGPLTGTATAPAGATSVIVSLAVGSNAYAGTVWFDDILLTKPGLMKQDLVSNLVDAWNTFWDGVFGTTGITGKIWSDMKLAGAWLTSQITTGANQLGALIAGLIGTPEQWIGNISKLVVDGIKTVGDMVDGLWKGLTGAAEGVGKTVQNLVDGATALAAQAGTALGNAGAALNQIGAQAAALLGTPEQVIGNISNVVMTGAKTVGTFVNQLFTEPDKVVGNIVNVVMDGVATVGGFLTDLWNGLTGQNTTTKKTSSNVRNVAGSVYTTSYTAFDQSVANALANLATNQAVYNGYFGFGGSGTIAETQATIAAIKAELERGYTLQAITYNSGTRLQLVRVVGAPTGGTFTLAYQGQTTQAIAHDASAAVMKARVEALSSIGPGNATVTYDPNTPWGRDYAILLARRSQKVTISGTPSGGTWTLTHKGETTAAIPHNATALDVQSALANLTNARGGSSLALDGSGDYLAMPYTPNFDLSGQTWTMECWFKLNGTGGGNIIAKDTYGQNFDWNIGVSPTTAQMYSNGTNTNLSVTFPALATGTWHHIAYVRQAGTLRCYVNGVQRGTSTMSISNASQSFVTVGCTSWNNPGGFFNGKISNLRIVKGGAIYPDGTTFTPPTSRLDAVAGTSLLMFRDVGFSDAAGGTYVRYGDAAPSSDWPFSGAVYGDVSVQGPTSGPYTVTFGSAVSGPELMTATATSLTGGINPSITVEDAATAKDSNPAYAYNLFTPASSFSGGSSPYTIVYPHWERPWGQTWSTEKTPAELYAICFGSGQGGGAGEDVVRSNPPLFNTDVFNGGVYGGIGGQPGGYAAIELDPSPTALSDYVWLIIAAGGAGQTGTRSPSAGSESYFGGYLNSTYGRYYYSNIWGLSDANQSAPARGGDGGMGIPPGSVFGLYAPKTGAFGLGRTNPLNDPNTQTTYRYFYYTGGTDGAAGTNSGGGGISLYTGGANGAGTYGGAYYNGYQPNQNRMEGLKGTDAVITGRTRAGGAGGGGGGGAFSQYMGEVPGNWVYNTPTEPQGDWDRILWAEYGPRQYYYGGFVGWYPPANGLTSFRNGGLGGNGGFPGGGGGGGGGAYTFNSTNSQKIYAGNGGNGGHGVVLLIWK